MLPHLRTSACWDASGVRRAWRRAVLLAVAGLIALELLAYTIGTGSLDALTRERCLEGVLIGSLAATSAWSALGPGRELLRWWIAFAVLTAAGMTLIPGHAQPMPFGEKLLAAMALLSPLIYLALQTTFVPLRLLTGCRIAAGGRRDVNTMRLQFSLRSLLEATTYVAVVVLMARQHLGPGDISALCDCLTEPAFCGWLLLVVILFCLYAGSFGFLAIWVGLGERSLLLRFGLLFNFTLAATHLLVSAQSGFLDLAFEGTFVSGFAGQFLSPLKYASSMSSRSDATLFLIGNLAFLVPVIGGATIARWCGYRLRRLPRATR